MEGWAPEVFGARPGSIVHHFSEAFGWNSVTWPQLTARVAGKSSLVGGPGDRGEFAFWWASTSFCCEYSFYCFVTESCLTLLRPHGLYPTRLLCHTISQASTLKWVAMPSSRGSSPATARTHISCIAGRYFTADRFFITELLGKPWWIQYPVSKKK